MMKKRSDLGPASAFLGISDPGLVKKTFFKVFFHKKLTGGPGDEISEIFCLKRKVDVVLLKNSAVGGIAWTPSPHPEFRTPEKN